MNKEEADKLLDLVKNSYNKIAVSFDVSRKKELWPAMRDLAEAVKDGDKILDAGCGNGRLLEAFKDKDIIYLGLDNSRELLEAARGNYPGRDFREADILDLTGVLEHDFDYIFCLAVLQHIPTPESRLVFLKNLAAKLAPTGQLIISSWNLRRSPKYRRMILKNHWLKITGRRCLAARDLVFPWRDQSGREVSDRYYHAFRSSELRRLSRQAGLSVHRFVADRYNFWLVLSRLS